MTAACGDHLDDCRCPYHPVARTPAEIAADHRAAVARAHRSGFAAAPLPGWLVEMLDPKALRRMCADPAGKGWAA